jgi:hypothetical protein
MELTSEESTTKTCRICKQEKELTEFYTKKDARDGYVSSCKLCEIETQIEKGNMGYAQTNSKHS